MRIGTVKCYGIRGDDDALEDPLTDTTIDLYRPEEHFTARETWLNDPNGLIFHGGRYHLFFQTNPSGSVWGNISWGHAVSTDLVHWDELDVAIRYDDQEHVFSGSIVFDRANTSGLGSAADPPLIAIYTSAYLDASPHAGTQAQSLAWSLDGGTTWTKYSGNPVLTRRSPDFRDPKVFRYTGGAGAYWVMVAVSADDRRVHLYRSDDLIEWTQLSSFGPANSTAGIWECPDLFELPLDGDPADIRWVLSVNVGQGGPNVGSAGQYFVGDFDGTTFTSRSTVSQGRHDSADPRDFDWLDWGRDYYAAVSFADEPLGRRLMIGWMNNWAYTRSTPTSPWRGSMSLVREVTLENRNGRPRLISRVVRDDGPARTTVLLRDETVTGIRELPAPGPAAYRLDIVADVDGGERIGVEVRRSADGTRATHVELRPSSRELVFDRSRAGDGSFSPDFASVSRAPLSGAPLSGAPLSGAPGSRPQTVAMSVHVDRTAIEVIADDGAVAVTELVYPAAGDDGLAVVTGGGPTRIRRLSITRPESSSG